MRSTARLLVPFALGSVVVLLALYWKTRGFELIDDDTPVYVLHPRVMAPPSWQNVWWLLTHPIEANWTPVTWYSHMLDHWLLGPNSGAHHLSNVVYHAAATAAVFLLLNRATASPWRSMAVASLFALHPLRVESVAWVVERKDTLSGLLGALCLWAYTHYTQSERARGRWYGAAWLLFVSAVLAKSMLITLPALMLVLDYWPLQRTRWLAGARAPVSLRQLLLETVAFVPPAVVVAYMARQGVGYTTAADDPLSRGQRWANATFSLAQYLRKSFFPVDLSFWYPHPYLPPTGGRGLAATTIVASAGLLLLLGLLCALNARKRPYLAVGFCWFVGMLVPVLGIYFQAGRQGMADRFTYFPSIGLTLLVVWAVAEWAQAPPSAARHRLVAGLLALSLLVFGYRSYVEAERWRTTAGLYADVLEQNPLNTHIHVLLGQLLLRSGQLDQGFAHLAEAATLTPEWDDLTTGLATQLRNAGRLNEALLWYQRAYAQSPQLNHTRINLATTLAMLGRNDEAIALSREAIAHNPRSLPAHLNLGMTLAQAGRLHEAAQELDRALAIDPSSTRALRISAQVLAASNDSTAARERLTRLLQLTPGDASARAMLEHLPTQAAATQPPTAAASVANAPPAATPR